MEEEVCGSNVGVHQASRDNTYAIHQVKTKQMLFELVVWKDRCESHGHMDQETTVEDQIQDRLG
jgi:hypothetical protein